jgi:hypothetical protein
VASRIIGSNKPANCRGQRRIPGSDVRRHDLDAPLTNSLTRNIITFNPLKQSATADFKSEHRPASDWNS